MLKDYALERYMEALLAGDRTGSRRIIEQCLQTGTTANAVYCEVLWPMMLEIDKLYREGKINSAQEHMASRINRTIVDQLQNKLPRKESKQNKIVISCASSEYGELGAQMAADLFESDGWEVRFLGGGVSNDELIGFIHNYDPDVFMIYGATPQLAPSVRQLIDTIRDINACPDMAIMLSGGVFDRADGLWEEIGADLYAKTAHRAVELANMPVDERPKPERTINVRKKRQTEPETAMA